MRAASGIIPARFGSSRFPGKPLAPILGRPMIQWVYERARQSKHLENVIIATDDRRIYDAARAFGADVRMTAEGHPSGTSRAAEIAAQVDSPIIVNIQGDEPLLHATMIDALVEALQDPSIEMATLAVREAPAEDRNDPNIVKLVMDSQNFALYFSRAAIPSGTPDAYWKHIGIYGYQKSFLLNFDSLPESRLEISEKLEQLRALENGYRIKIVETSHSTLSVDTPDDIIRVENRIKEGAND